MRTAALVDMTGTIDFCCWPRFDSPSIFASLLDRERGGRFELAAAFDAAQARQLYFHETNVLLTRALSRDGVAEISDFMSVGDADGGPRLVRRIKAVRNDVRFHMLCAPAFDYGRAEHRLESEDGSHVFTSGGPGGIRLRLRSNVRLEIDGGASRADFVLPAGDTAFFILEDAAHGAQSVAVTAEYVPQAFKATCDFWRAWSGRSAYRGRWREVVNRSALTLKLLTSVDHGSVVAAPTFGLPELAGGTRNWDYRYTWLRDSAFTVYALLRLGYVDEANAFMRWLQARAEDSGSDGTLRAVYRLDGGSELSEMELPHLDGYAGSRPVRIGNGAEHQLQIDIYGEFMDSLYLSDKYGEQVSWRGWNGIVRTVNWVAANWSLPDDGIWEFRRERASLLHTKVMCWVALDRAVRVAMKRSLPAPLETWIAQRDALYQFIHERFWNEALGAFVQAEGSDRLDAACLLMPLVRFIAPTDPRWLSTLRAVEDQLTDDSLVFRYRGSDGADGIAGGEGTFNMCSFWFVECVARSGDLPKARYLFEKMLGYANHLGLFSEETGTAGEHMGNFPQAFTHMALISAAFYLDRALGSA